MMSRMRALGSVCAVAVVALGMSPRAGAAPITGGIGFAGGIAATDLLTTNSIDIVDDVANLICYSGAGVPCTGTYAAVNSANPGQAIYNDFTFNPLPAGGYAPLWIFTRLGITYSFDLTNVTTFGRTPDGFGGSAGITVSGFGIARVTGFDDTQARWSFSVSMAAQTYRFSATTGTTPSSQTEVDVIFEDGFESGG